MGSLAIAYSDATKLVSLPAVLRLQISEETYALYLSVTASVHSFVKKVYSRTLVLAE